MRNFYKTQRFSKLKSLAFINNFLNSNDVQNKSDSNKKLNKILYILMYIFNLKLKNWYIKEIKSMYRLRRFKAARLKKSRLEGGRSFYRRVKRTNLKKHLIYLITKYVSLYYNKKIENFFSFSKKYNKILYIKNKINYTDYFMRLLGSRGMRYKKFFRHFISYINNMFKFNYFRTRKFFKPEYKSFKHNYIKIVSFLKRKFNLNLKNGFGSLTSLVLRNKLSIINLFSSMTNKIYFIYFDFLKNILKKYFYLIFNSNIYYYLKKKIIIILITSNLIDISKTKDKK